MARASAPPGRSAGQVPRSADVTAVLRLDHPDYVAEMLVDLGEANAGHAVHALITRAADLYDPGDIAWLLEMLS